LYNTLRRSAPITCIGKLRVRRHLALPVVLLLFLTPLIVISGVLWDREAVETWLRTEFSYGRLPLPDVWLIWLIFILFFLTAYVWARLLLGVGQKYNIKSAMETPCTSLIKNTICICTANVRVGLHVDRAQGYLGPGRAHETLVALSEALREQLREQAPPQASMV